MPYSEGQIHDFENFKRVIYNFLGQNSKYVLDLNNNGSQMTFDVVLEMLELLKSPPQSRKKRSSGHLPLVGSRVFCLSR